MNGFDPARAFRLDGTVSVITGGARGIGRAIAFGAARSGATVHLFDRDGDAAARTAAEIAAEGLSARGHAVDVTHEAAVVAAFDTIAAEGRIDSLVNNAGMALRRPSVELSREEFERVIDVNLTGVFLCARTAARHMLRARRGAIVNVASIMGLSGGGLYPNISYQASKGAVVNLTRALAVEWAASGISRERRGADLGTHGLHRAVAEQSRADGAHRGGDADGAGGRARGDRGRGAVPALGCRRHGHWPHAARGRRVSRAVALRPPPRAAGGRGAGRRR